MLFHATYDFMWPIDGTIMAVLANRHSIAAFRGHKLFMCLNSKLDHLSCALLLLCVGRLDRYSLQWYID